MFGRGILWRNLGNPVRLGPLDGRAIIFIIIFMYHWRMWTFALCIVGMLTLFIVERRGYTVPNLYRRAKVLLSGPLRPQQTARRIRSDI